MKTKLIKNILIASGYIKQGNVAAFPTETVYGLGANVFDENAVKEIFKVKGRPADNPMIVHVNSKSQIKILSREITPSAKKIIDKFFPGAVTVVLKKNEIISDIVTAGLDTIAIRMPSSKIARKFINACGVPIAAPSANLSGSPSPTSYHHVLNDFKGKIPCILIGPNAKHGIESTVVDCSVEPPVILRPGVVTFEQLRKVVKDIRVASRNTKTKSPGMSYKHYAPKGKVQTITNYELRITNVTKHSAFIGITKIPDELKKKFKEFKICKSIEDYAKNLFSFFRECDEKEIKIIYAEKVSEKGIGMAIMNRLRKASL